MRKIALILIASAAGILGLGMVAQAGSYPGEVTITVSKSTLAPGEGFTAKLTGCQSGEMVDFTVQGSSGQGVCATSAGAGSNGFAFAFVAQTTTTSATGPLTAPPAVGTYDVTGTGRDSQATATTQITVTTTQPSGNLPDTGSGSSSTTVPIAGGLLFIGLALFSVSQVRRRQSTAI